MNISDIGYEYIKTLSGLLRLDLAGVRGLKGHHLAILKELDNLQYLSLFDTGLVGPVLAHLPEFFSKLRGLNIGRNRIDSSALKEVAKIKTLETLIISENQIGTGSALAHLNELGGLKNLHLGGTRITDAELKYLARNPTIEKLGLNELSSVTDQSVSTLLSLPKLKKVNIHRTGIKQKGSQMLKDRGIEFYSGNSICI